MNSRRTPHDDRPIAPIAATDLNRLIDTLMVQFVWLSECLVGEGYRLDMGGIGAPGIHYNLAGAGWLIVGDDAPIEVTPHTLVVVPANSPRSLARAASLSRSAFMARFTSAVGRSPMTVLRELRMRQAAEQLTSSALTADRRRVAAAEREQLGSGREAS